MALPREYHLNPRGQCAILLLSALHVLYIRHSQSCASKRQVIAYISQKHWFDLNDEDRTPYPSQRHLSDEPRWHTLIAWARKDAVIHDLVSYEAKDSWGLTRRGRDGIERFQARVRSRPISVSACFLWSPVFKQFLQPSYVPEPTDAKRPRLFYRDTLSKFIDDLLR